MAANSYWEGNYWNGNYFEQNYWSGFGTGKARRRRMAFALATGVRRNLGYMLILIVPFFLK